mgnify:CR=1 FL=1
MSKKREFKKRKIGAPGKSLADGYKEEINEGFIEGLLTLMSFAIIGKVIFYFFVQLVDRGLKYFSSSMYNFSIFIF